MDATSDHPQEDAAILRIDLSQLDPQKINPDEDGHPRAGEYDSWEQAVEDGQGDWDWENWKTLGQWAEQTGFGDDPDETVEQLNSYSSLAYQGIVPPSAIELMNIADDGTVMFNEDEFGPHLAGKASESQRKMSMPLSPDSPGMPEYFYHVAPAEHHEQIMKQGLIPGQEDTSPWTADRQEWNFDFDAPSGVYLWDNLDHARQYAHVLASKAHDLPEFPDEWQDRYPEWFVDPEDSYWEEEGMEPPEPEQPPSWNIYLIPADKVTDLRMDPEAWQKNGELTFEEAMNEIETGGDDVETTEGHRYYTPNPIPASDIRLVETRSLADMGLYDFESENSDWAEGSYNARVPEPLTRVPDLLDSPLANPNWPKEAADIPQGEKVFEIRQPFLMDNEGNMVVGYMGTHHEGLDPDYVTEVFGLPPDPESAWGPGDAYWDAISPLEGHILWLDDGPHIQWPSALDASRWDYEERLLDYAEAVRKEGEWIDAGSPTDWKESSAWDETDSSQLTFPNSICPQCGYPSYLFQINKIRSISICPEKGHRINVWTDDRTHGTYVTQFTEYYDAPGLEPPNLDLMLNRRELVQGERLKALNAEIENKSEAFRQNEFRQANAWESVDEEGGNMLPDGIPCNNCGAPTYHMPGLREQDSFFLCPECNHVSHDNDSFSMPKREIAEDIEEHGWSRFKRNSKVSSIWDREVTINSKASR